jgi:formylglycine-generating enzyme
VTSAFAAIAAAVLVASGCGSPARQTPPPGMATIPGGEFSMGLDDPAHPDAGPVHPVRVASFWMDVTEVTNAQFDEFVASTGYSTVAERPPLPAEAPGVPPEWLRAGSIVFVSPGRPVPLDDPSRWWHYVPGARWRQPEGPSSDISTRGDHPVVHIAFDDAVAYAAWAGKRLPTEAEWEYAARGGLDGARYVWGDRADADGPRRLANTFQGRFPHTNAHSDGYVATSPACSYPPNGFGLCDMSGNAWEWVSDWYRPDYYRMLAASGGVADDPRGPSSSIDPDEPGVAKRVQKGGSFLCTDDYCGRYLPGARGKGEPRSSASHIGFRLVKDIPK